ncbi:MAG: DotI/IcmL family type IV secretion protein [Legionellaceae bacterium]|nr:DotI/IcmL family type IV secretion protein [Legionellaceae bacterium]
MKALTLGICTLISGISQAAATPVTPGNPASASPVTSATTTSAPAATTTTTTTTTTGVAPAATTTSVPKNSTVAAAPAVIDCHLHIPAENNQIDTALIAQWASKAAEQSFRYDFQNMDAQLTELHYCYTDRGWQSFQDALKQSGNIAAIKQQQLSVSGMSRGDANITIEPDNYWRVNLPLRVVYQNDKEKLTQNLEVSLLISRQITGDLGIVQIIASPEKIFPDAPKDTGTNPGVAPDLKTKQ